MYFKHFRGDEGAISVCSKIDHSHSERGRTAIAYVSAFQNPIDQFNKSWVNSLLRGRIETPNYVFLGIGEKVSHHVIIGKILADIYARGVCPYNKTTLLLNELNSLTYRGGLLHE